MISIKANNIPHFSLDVTIVVGKTLRYSKHTTPRDKTEQHFIQSDNKLNLRKYINIISGEFRRKSSTGVCLFS
jgi:hypothetical protein